jgi:hypothetical protein
MGGAEGRNYRCVIFNKLYAGRRTWVSLTRHQSAQVLERKRTIKARPSCGREQKSHAHHQLSCDEKKVHGTNETTTTTALDPRPGGETEARPLHGPRALTRRRSLRTMQHTIVANAEECVRRSMPQNAGCEVTGRVGGDEHSSRILREKSDGRENKDLSERKIKNI